MGNTVGIIVIVISVILLVGGAAAYIGWRERGYIKAAQAWPTVSGKILTASVDIKQGKGISYYPHVTYQYEVNGQTYQSDLLNAGASLTQSTSKQGVEQYINERYQPGTTVQVYYSPQDPQIAVLEHHMGGGNFFLFQAGCMLIIVVMLVVIALFTFALNNSLKDVTPQF